MHAVLVGALQGEGLMPKEARKGPSYFYVTWLTRLLTGEKSCHFEAWTKGHFKINEKARKFDNAEWVIEHTKMVNDEAARLFADGWQVSVENQNKFSIVGRRSGAMVGGKPDIVARRMHEIRVLDAKSGRPKDADVAQVACYIVFLPLVWEMSDVRIDGTVFYKDGTRTEVSYESALGWRAKIFEKLQQIAQKDAPRALPSDGDCHFCDLTKDDCEVRHGEGPAIPFETSEF